MRFIGDVHNKMLEYRKITNDCESSIQVGDFGIGFPSRENNITYDELVGEIDTSQHRWIRGNHDNPHLCKNFDSWIPDGHIQDIGKYLALFIGGATSPDRHLRIQDRDWWPEENLDYQQQNYVIDQCRDHNPDIIVSHTLPSELLHLIGKYPYDICSTARLLDHVWHICRPKLWICGHFHTSFNDTYRDCRIIVLNELEYVDITF